MSKDTPLWVSDPESGCWNWVKVPSDTGYGVYQQGGRRSRRSILAHRWVYETMVGPIPIGLQLDHLCRNRRCVNPAHLEPVSPRVNILRGTAPSAIHARQTHCVSGHPFDEENTYHPPGRPHTRQCRACARERDKHRKRRAA